MEDMAKSLRTIPGYKNIILFSNGFPRSLYEGDTFLQKNYDRMAQEFATANSPVHTVNTEGGRQYSRPVGARGDSALKNLSQLSGGRHFQNVQEHESISRELQAMTGNYYVLGYYAGEVVDGEYHTIKVEVKRPGCRVLAQSGYFNPKPFPKLTKFEKQLHLYDLAMNDMPQLQQNVPVIPLQALSFAEQGENLVLLTEIDIPSLNEVIGERSELVTLIYDSDFQIHLSNQAELDGDAFTSQRIFHYSVESLPPGSFVCRVVIRNLDTGKGAVGRADITIAEPAGQGIKLYPPLLFRTGSEVVFHRAVAAEKEQEKTKSLKDIYPYIGEDTLPLFLFMTREHVPLMAVLKCRIQNIPEPATAVNMILIDENGQKTAVPFEVVDVQAEGDYDTLLLNIRLPKMAPGRYSLEFTAHENSSGKKSSVQRPLIIR